MDKHDGRMWSVAIRSVRTRNDDDVRCRCRFDSRPPTSTIVHRARSAHIRTPHDRVSEDMTCSPCTRHTRMVHQEARSLSSVHLLPHDDERSPSHRTADHLVLHAQSDDVDVPPSSGQDRRRLPSSSPAAASSAAFGSAVPSVEQQLAAHNRARHRRLCQIGCAILAAFCLLVLIIALVSELNSTSAPAGSKYDTLDACLTANRPPNLSAKQPASTRPPVTPVTPPPVLFTHANIWNGVAALLTDADLLIENGKVTSISTVSGERLTPPSNPSLVTYDATGRYITPGIIDLHSHAGLGAWPVSRGTNQRAYGGLIGSRSSTCSCRLHICVCVWMCVGPIRVISGRRMISTR
jgi:hypothetical protein